MFLWYILLEQTILYAHLTLSNFLGVPQQHLYCQCVKYQ